MPRQGGCSEETEGSGVFMEKWDSSGVSKHSLRRKGGQKAFQGRKRNFKKTRVEMSRKFPEDAEQSNRAAFGV